MANIRTISITEKSLTNYQMWQWNTYGYILAANGYDKLVPQIIATDKDVTMLPSEHEEHDYELIHKELQEEQLIINHELLSEKI
jgi:hypothetical protein